MCSFCVRLVDLGWSLQKRYLSAFLLSSSSPSSSSLSFCVCALSEFNRKQQANLQLEKMSSGAPSPAGGTSGSSGGIGLGPAWRRLRERQRQYMAVAFPSLVDSTFTTPTTRQQFMQVSILHLSCCSLSLSLPLIAQAARGRPQRLVLKLTKFRRNFLSSFFPSHCRKKPVNLQRISN